MSSLKYKHLHSLAIMEFKVSQNPNKKIWIDSESLEKGFPQILKYNAENIPIAIDKNQLLLLALVKLQEQEKVIQDLTSFIKSHEQKINILQSKIE